MTPSERNAQVDPRRHAPATQRNRTPILEVLSRVLPGRGTVLELASGTGEHAVWFAQHLRPLVWQPSDPDPEMRRSIAAHAAGAGLDSLKPPLDIDVISEDWPLESAEVIVCINLLHIAPWSAAVGLMRGAARLLPVSGVLYLYGPFKRGGTHTSESNRAFDEALRSENRAWGLRNLEEVADLAAEHGLALDEVVDMPANNLSVIFRRL